MKLAIIAGAFLLTNLAGPAMAICPSNEHLSASDIQTLLAPGTGVYICYNNGTRRENNETLLTGTTSGIFQEYHSGGSTMQNEGNYTITGGTNGVVTYNYTSGGSFIYRVCTIHSGTAYTLYPQTGSGANISVTITPGPGSC